MITKKSSPSRGRKIVLLVVDACLTSTLDRQYPCRLPGLDQLPSSCRLPPIPRCLPALSELLDTVLPPMAPPPSEPPSPSLSPHSQVSELNSLDSAPRRGPWPPPPESGHPPCLILNHWNLWLHSFPFLLSQKSIHLLLPLSPPSEANSFDSHTRTELALPRPLEGLHPRPYPWNLCLHSSRYQPLLPTLGSLPPLSLSPRPNWSRLTMKTSPMPTISRSSMIGTLISS